MDEKLFSSLFATLNILVLERLRKGFFHIQGEIPEWLGQICPREVVPGMKVLISQEDIPFLQNFLIDAEEFWQKPSTNQLKSGFWSEIDLKGNECFLEASALIIEDRKILLVEFAEDNYHEKQALIQKAREKQLSHDHLVKEYQKKDILIHCIIHDIAGQLSGINCCLALLEMENLTPKGRERLAVGRKQSIKQEILVREVLEVFSAEINSLEQFSQKGAIAPNILHVAQECIELLSPIYTLNQVRLKLVVENQANLDWKVIGDRQRLERVITNLAENAFRHSPSNSTVTITLKSDYEYIYLIVDDEGSGVNPEIAPNIFQKFTQGSQKKGRIGLGLYFCRITIERWGGNVGYLDNPNGGARFWFCLPRAR